MQKSESKLTVYFEEPFWVGVYERYSDGILEVCKLTFGAEPKDYEVYEFFLNNFSKLEFSPAVPVEKISEEKINPKRMQREINKQLNTHGIGTKSQQALKLQQEANKNERMQKSKQRRDEEIQKRFELRQEKKKEKHRGH